jgi:asparagine synthase (glutamine-hydrolysing)
MCGICGLLHLNPARPVDEALLRRMTDVMAHRGPDDDGFHFDRGLGLGHRRLSIIDLAGGHQPLCNEDGTVWIAFNGEIYNYKPLAEELKARGHRFRTRSDTETSVHAYEEYGEAFVHRLRGMFAFAIWDAPKKKLVLVRDRVGIKPVYYTVHRDTLYFASEIKSIFQNPEIPRELNPDAIDYYLTFRYVPGPMTLLRNIFKLPAGSMLIAREGRVEVKPYWDLEFHADEDLSLQECAERFERKAREAVEIRLMSEVPLGAFLSGGLDSSLVVAFMSGMIGEPVRTFSVGYENKPHVNEFAFARQVAERYKTHHRELQISAKKFSDFVPLLVWHLDEPVADFACLPLYFLSKLTREHVTVILSGEGADELLAGYYLYKKMLLIERLRRFPGFSLLAPALAGYCPEGKLRRYLQQAGMPLERRYRGITTTFTAEQRARLFPASRVQPVHLEDYTASLLDKVKGQHPLNRMLYFETRVHLVDDLLVKADKMTMAIRWNCGSPFSTMN